MSIPLSDIRMAHDFTAVTDYMMIRGAKKTHAVQIFNWDSIRGTAANMLLWSVAREMYHLGEQHIKLLECLKLRLEIWVDGGHFVIDAFRMQVGNMGAAWIYTKAIAHLLESWQRDVCMNIHSEGRDNVSR